VRDVLSVVERVTGRTIARRSAPRRAGDPAILFASAERIRSELGWRASRPELETIVRDAWRWHSTHPQGFRSALANAPNDERPERPERSAAKGERS
jgi:UDP-glucose 4-epimerase